MAIQIKSRFLNKALAPEKPAWLPRNTGSYPAPPGNALQRQISMISPPFFNNRLKKLKIVHFFQHRGFGSGVRGNYPIRILNFLEARLTGQS